MAEYSVVGKRLPRVDAFSKVTGGAIFSGDVTLPNMLYGKILRCPYAHAAIKKLDVTKARALDGVKAVITAEDVPGYKHKSPLLLLELPRLAKDRVVYSEQPVAVVAATTVKIAEAALKLIETEYEELPPVLDVLDALKPETPLIHNDLFTNLMTFPVPQKSEKPSNIAYRFSINKGDVETAFKEADVVIENTYRTRPIHHGYIEPLSAVASVDTGGKVTIWMQSQGIFLAQECLCEWLGLPAEKIKVMPVEIGGAFGGKTFLPVGPLVALLAIKTGRPVRMEMTRDEVLKDCRPAPGAVITIKTGAKKDGQIIAVAAKFIYDSGAYPEMSNSMFISINAFGQYKIPNLRIESMDVITNKVPATYYRAPAMPQASFAIESNMDLIARALGIDPLQLRIQNINSEGDRVPIGEVLQRVGFKETLQRMADYLNQKGKIEGKNRGRGVACGYWGGASGGYGAYVRLNVDGSVSFISGVTDISGARTSVAQIIAEEFGLPLSKVSVVVEDTDAAPWANVSVGSATVYSLSTAAYRACQDAKVQLINLAAGKLKVEPAQVEFVQGKFQLKNDPQKQVTLADIAAGTVGFRGTGPVIGKGTSGVLRPAPTMSVHAADVEVDEETGKVKIVSYAVAQDVGKAINPLSIEGQIQGAVTQGVGWALMEGHIYEKGVLQNTTFLDYRIPTATDIPMIDTMIVEVPSSTGVYGLRHAGEPPMIPALAAIANAVHSATGVRFKELPMNPETVLKGIKAKT
jgi:xanthine dehydrogenase molybdenum-binding subunit